MDWGLGIRVKLGRLPVGHKSHPPSSPRSLPISSVVDVSQEKRLHGRSITGFIHLVGGGMCSRKGSQRNRDSFNNQVCSLVPV